MKKIFPNAVPGLLRMLKHAVLACCEPMHTPSEGASSRGSIKGVLRSAPFRGSCIGDMNDMGATGMGGDMGGMGGAMGGTPHGWI